MYLKQLVIISLILSGFLVKAQEINISGQLIDKRTLESLCFVNIQVNGTNMGTITDKTGRFNLKVPNKYVNKSVSFSYIGYKTLLKPVNELTKYSTIAIEQQDVGIGEIIVMPDSTLLTLLEKAYKKIPDNYPTFPTKLKGFYRETIKTKEKEYLYFSEAVTETYKSSYKFSADNGQVKILKSLVNEFPDLDSLEVRFYGGIFNNEDDFVKKRRDFINPHKFDNYSYSVSITTYQDKDIYVISFDTKNDSLKGTKKGKFYIEKSSLAYIGGEFEKTKRGLNNYNLRSPVIKAKEYTSKVLYIQYNNKWHFKYCADNMLFQRKQHTYTINFEFITTEILTDSVKPIPFGERLEFADIFSEKAKNYYSDDYWGEYNVLKKDSTLDNQIKLLYDTAASKKLLTQKTPYKRKNNLIKILSKLDVGYGLEYSPVYAETGFYSLNYQYNDKTVSLTDELGAFQYNINFLAQLNYKLNYRWALSFAVHKSLNKKLNIKTYDIGASYNMLLNKRARPLILRLSISGSFNSFARNFSIYENNSGFEFGSKSIDAEKLQFGIGFNTIGIKPGITLEYNLRRKLWLNISADYYIQVYSEEKLFLQEKSGFFLTRKKANISLTDNSLEITHNGSPTNKSHLNFDNYTLSLGFMIKF